MWFSYERSLEDIIGRDAGSALSTISWEVSLCWHACTASAGLDGPFQWLYFSSKYHIFWMEGDHLRFVPPHTIDAKQVMCIHLPIQSTIPFRCLHKSSKCYNVPNRASRRGRLYNLRLDSMAFPNSEMHSQLSASNVTQSYSLVSTATLILRWQHPSHAVSLEIVCLDLFSKASIIPMQLLQRNC